MDPLTTLAFLGEPSPTKGALLFIGGVLVVLGSLLSDRARAGLLRCSACGGSGEYRSQWRRGAFGKCPACDGSGQRRRIL
jgi:hypothetical protein